MESHTVDFVFHGTAHSFEPHLLALRLFTRWKETCDEKTNIVLGTVCGVSSGSVAGVCLICFHEDVENYKYIMDIIGKGAMGNTEYDVETIHLALMKYLPSDAYIKCSNVLHICYHRLHTRTLTMEKISVNEYHSNQELADYVVRSCSIPFITSYPYITDGFIYLDGISVPKIILDPGHIRIISSCDRIRLFPSKKAFSLVHNDSEMDQKLDELDIPTTIRLVIERGKRPIYMSRWYNYNRFVLFIVRCVYRVVTFVVNRYTLLGSMFVYYLSRYVPNLITLGTKCGVNFEKI